jgi:hypothetical protein
MVKAAKPVLKRPAAELAEEEEEDDDEKPLLKRPAMWYEQDLIVYEFECRLQCTRDLGVIGVSKVCIACCPFVDLL